MTTVRPMHPSARLLRARRRDRALPAWVRAVGVRASARGTGVAAAIMDYCAESAAGATALALHTRNFMPVAVRPYQRLGYERVPEWDFEAGSGAFTAVAYRLMLKPR